MGPRLPDRIELRVGIVFVVAGMVVVEADAGRGDAEHVGGAPIQVGVELDLEVLGLRAIVAAAHRRLNGDTRTAAHSCPDPERAVVEQEAHLHRIGRRRSLDRLGLQELRNRRGLLPRFLVQPAVEPNRSPRDACGARLLAAVDRRLLGMQPSGGDANDDQTQKRTSPWSQ